MRDLNYVRSSSTSCFQIVDLRYCIDYFSLGLKVDL